MYQFFYDLRACRGSSDPGALDLLTQFLVLDQLTGIFHGKHHGTRGIAFRRGSLSLFDGITVYRKHISFLQGSRKLDQSFVFLILFFAPGDL